MTPMRIAGLVLFTALFAAPVLAQQDSIQTQPQPHVPVPLKGEGPQAVPVAPEPQFPAFESLVKHGPDGKVIRLEGVMDILAFHRNPLIDAKTLDAIKPSVVNWLADVDQLAIDNL